MAAGLRRSIAVQHIQKARAVGLGKRPPAALPERIGAAQIGHQIAGGKDGADIGGGQFLPRRASAPPRRLR